MTFYYSLDNNDLKSYLEYYYIFNNEFWWDLFWCLILSEQVFYFGTFFQITKKMLIKLYKVLV